MKDLNEPKILSNTSVVDILFIDEISDNLTCGEKIEPKDIVNLARLIETFILSKEVVIREDEVVWTPMMHYNHNYDFEFTDSWIETFSKNNIIRTENDSASTLLSNRYFQYNSLKNPIMKFYDKSEFDFMCLKEREDSTRAWWAMTSDLSIPFIESDWEKSILDARRCTNISLYAYQKIENYLKEKLECIGSREIRIPSLLGMVLQEARYIEDIPKVAVQIRNDLSKFVNKVTKLEYQFKIAKTDRERKEIYRMIDNIFKNIVNISYNGSKSKKYFLNIILNIIKYFNIIANDGNIWLKIIGASEPLVEIFNDIKKIDNEASALYSIAGYYNFFDATKDVEESLPLLKKIFGKQIDDEFVIKLNNMKI